MATREQALGPIADKVIFENERVRIWELRLPAGVKGPVHRHDLDHVLIAISGDRVAVEPEPGSSGPYADYLEAEVVPGSAIYVTRGGLEAAHNVGRREFHEIIVELKD